jgi:hypothetical protein
MVSEHSSIPYELYQGIGISPPAMEQFSRMPKIPFYTKEELDDLVRALSDIDIISWTMSEDCCFARADLVIQFLELMGVPADHLFKQYVLTHSITDDPKDVEWKFYHTAPLIKLADGSEWILDPALNKTSALTRDEWIPLLQPAIPETPQIIDDYREINEFIIYSTGVIGFKIPHNLIIAFSENRHHLNIIPNYSQSTQRRIAKILAESRANVERQWIQQ